MSHGISFTSSLERELSSGRYVGKIRDCGVEVAFFTLNVENKDRPTLQLLYGSGISEECSLWEIVLDDETMQKHMEEDVEISTSLNEFASYFCDAILNGPQIPLVPQCFPVVDHAKTIAMKLIYSVGNMQLEGLLRLNLVQNRMPKAVFEMMSAFSVGVTSQVTKESRSSRLKSDTVTIMKQPKLSSETAEAEEPIVENAESGPVKAKKRKAGGVNLFAGRKK